MLAAVGSRGNWLCMAIDTGCLLPKVGLCKGWDRGKELGRGGRDITGPEREHVQ